MRFAFKERAVVVDSSGCGEEILILHDCSIQRGAMGVGIEHELLLAIGSVEELGRW